MPEQISPEQQSKSQKIFVLYFFLVLGFLIFLANVFYHIAFKENRFPITTNETFKAKRGNILSSDGYVIVNTKQLYKVEVNTKSIDPNKKELFVNLVNIHTQIPKEEIRKKLAKKRGFITLSYSLSAKNAQYLKNLNRQLVRMKVFKSYKNSRGQKVLYALTITPSGESREYIYKDFLTPLIGYTHKYNDERYTKVAGIKGLEKSYEDIIDAERDGRRWAYKDINGYMIFNNQSINEKRVNGMDVVLNISVILQKRMERILTQMKEELKAKEIMAAVMDSKTGKVYAMASSNRFNPSFIRKKDYSSLNANFIEYSFEPGSVLKPITFAILLENEKVNPFDIVYTEGGKYRLGRRIIRDEHPFEWLSAENVVVQSSNIGMIKIVENLSAVEFYEGLQNFGFTKKSGLDLPYEKTGSLPSLNQLKSIIYRGSTSYGYGMRANFMQVLKAYSSFNNKGTMVTPQIVSHFIDSEGKKIPLRKEEPVQVTSQATAQKVQKILMKVVKEASGKKAQMQGLDIGGKTGTAHIAERKGYVRRYNSSFFGFANDKNKRYTIGVTVVDPKKKYYHFASLTAVPTFKKIVQALVDEGYLSPEVTKEPKN